MSAVIVDPRFRLPYHTFVLQGIDDSGLRIEFRRLGGRCGEGMCMEYDGRRVYVDTNDMARVEQDPFDWADVVGKVNIELGNHDPSGKLRSLGPVFGIRRWNLPLGYRLLPRLVAHGADPRSTIAGLRFQGLTRLPIDRYVPSQAGSGFIHLRSRDWSGRHEPTILPRRRFIEAVERTGIAHDATITGDRIPLEQYLDATARSTVVFNAPAVHDCLGWKLGEYLALGKAIISTPLGRALPTPLEHGIHIHYVRDDVDDMADAIRRINGDIGYRRQLERGARWWYDQHMTPLAVVRRLLGPAAEQD